MKQVKATEAYFIKLGREGDWEQECLREGTLRLGYAATPHELCLQGEWEAVWKIWCERRNGDKGAATRDTKQIRTFYEADEGTLFITFVNGLLYWCRPSGPVELLSDGGRRRGTGSGWYSVSTGGTPLTMDRLSGSLLKVQMFQGTICKVKAIDYLVHKLNDELSPEVAAAEDAERALMDAIVRLMRLLTWQDFELLVDLIFSRSGWQRVSRTGGPQKTVDLELLLPTTRERAFVQVKSQADAASLREYAARFEDAIAYQWMFFVWHTGEISPEWTEEDAGRIRLVGPDQLSRMVLDAGLSSWLREKVS